MLPPFRFGLGGPIGSGRQYLAWIHIDDMVNGILWLLDNELRGPFNMVSPYPVRNEQFAHALGHALHRPTILRVPATAIRLLMGESSVLVLGGQRALPKAGRSGFCVSLVRFRRGAGGCRSLMWFTANIRQRKR